MKYNIQLQVYEGPLEITYIILFLTKNPYKRYIYR